MQSLLKYGIILPTFLHIIPNRAKKIKFLKGIPHDNNFN